MNRCPVCTKDNPAGEQICQYCGTTIGGPALAAPSPSGSVPALFKAVAATSAAGKMSAQTSDHATASSTRGKQERKGKGTQRTAANNDGNLLVAMLLGLGITVALYAAFWQLQSLPVVSMFYRPGVISWVQPTELFLSTWVMALLFLKWLKYRRQRKPFALEVLPATPQAIAPKDIPDVLSHIGTLPAAAQVSLLVNRVRRCVLQFQSRPHRTEVTGFLAAQGDADAVSVASSYVIPRVLIWAIPILGFAGTVLGIDQAIAGMSTLSDIKQLESSLSVITRGLAGAFETTLIALVLSMLLMFPMSVLEKAEQDLLARIDAFCADHLVPRLEEPTRTLENPQEFAHSVSQTMLNDLREGAAEIGAAYAAAFIAKSRTLIFDALGKLGEELNAHRAKQQESVDTLRQQLEGTATTLQSAATAAAQLAGELDSRQQKLESSTRQFGAQLDALIQRSEELVKSQAQTVADTTVKFGNMTNQLVDQAKIHREALANVGGEFTRGLGDAGERLAVSEQTLARAVEIQQRALDAGAHRANIQALKLALIQAAGTLDGPTSPAKGGNGSGQSAAG